METLDPDLDPDWHRSDASINICAKREFHGSGGVWQVSKVVF